MEKIECRVCGEQFPRSDMVTVEGISVCPACKPLFERKLCECMNAAGTNRPKKEQLASLVTVSTAPASSEAAYGLQGWRMEPELGMPKPRVISSSGPRWPLYIAALALGTVIALQFHLYDHLLRLYILHNGATGVGAVESTKRMYAIRSYERDKYLLGLTYAGPEGKVYRVESLISSHLMELPKGFPVRIHYLPSRPDLGALDDDGGQGRQDLILMSFLVLLVSSVPLPGLMRIRKARRILSIGDVVPAQVERVMAPRTSFGSYRLIVRFSYRGREWQSKTNTNSKRVTSKVGDVITLLVDPEDPKSVVAYTACGYRVVGRPGRFSREAEALPV